MFIDYYKLFNISYTASNEEISQAFQEKMAHQKQNYNLTDYLVSNEIEKAYLTLKNPEKRFKYNLKLINKYQKKRSSRFKSIIKKLFKYDPH